MRRADEGMGFILQYENVAWYEEGKVRILDRRIYPLKKEFVICNSYREVAKAIKDMVTQSGGPYTAAAMGMALAAYEGGELSGKELLTHMEEAAYALSHARPTTSAAMEKITSGAMDLVRENVKKGLCGKELVEPLRLYAFNYINDKYKKYEKVGSYLADLVPENGTVMTQCFAETVLGTFIRECHRRNSNIKMICAETRPYFQGARLTASLACDMGVDVSVITDNMPAFIMKDKKVDVFTSAADVITMDGHIVNKIGTFQMALAAAWHEIPYYVTGAPDRDHETVDSVKIEYRDPELVKSSMGTRVTMEGVKALYPAFDITPPKLCNGVVTDKGVFSPYTLNEYFQCKKDN